MDRPAGGAGDRVGSEAALRRALACRPDTIVLLSDGLTGHDAAALADRADLLTLIDTANTTDAVIHTAQLRVPDPLATATRRGTLDLIARRTGGVHRFVSEAEMADAAQ